MGPAAGRLEKGIGVVEAVRGQGLLQDEGGLDRRSRKRADSIAPVSPNPPKVARNRSESSIKSVSSGLNAATA